MFNIILYQPEIPPNTGNIIRLCANAGAMLHLIEPLGFSLNDNKLKRAGLDYHEWAQIKIHKNFACYEAQQGPNKLYACSTKGTCRYSDLSFKKGDAFLFGPESRGLPTSVLTAPAITEIITIPMQPYSRSLNLANAVAIILYEAWRQQDFIPLND